MADSKLNKILATTVNETDDFLYDEAFSFNEYKSSSEIAKLITDSVMKDCWTKRGFVFDSSDAFNKKSIGLISNIMGLSTLMELNDMEMTTVGDDTSFAKYIDRFQFLVQDIFKRIYAGDGTLNFDATPYIDDKSIVLTTYVETITKTFIVMTDLREMLLLRSRSSFFDGLTWNICGKEVNGNSELLIEVERLMLDCMNALCKSCLKNENAFEYKINGKVVNRLTFPSKVEYKGWSYQDFSDEETVKGIEPSLFFTFYATNAFMNFYSSFTRTFRWADEKGEEEINLGGLSEEEFYKVKEDWIFYNNNKDLITKLRYQVSSSGRYFEQRVLGNGVDLAFDWVDKDLKPLPYDFVNNEQKSNCIIDTLFLLNIYFNAGVDEDYEWLSKQSQDEFSYKDYFYETIDYSLKNILKAYNISKRKGNEDLISSYSLLFNEKIPEKYRSACQKLRKSCQNVGVYDMVPLLCNTYFLVAKYMVNYPQVEMQKFLNMIIENMHGDDWYWSKEGYNVNNNLYYVLALENFYSYYDTYEAQFIENGQKCVDLNREISRLNTEIRERDIQRQKIEKDNNKQIEKLQTEWQIKLDGKVSALDAAVNELVEAKVAQLVKEYTFKYLSEAVNDTLNIFAGFCRENQKGLLSNQTIIDTLKNNPDVYNMFMIALLPEINMELAKNNEVKNSSDDYRIDSDNSKVSDGVATTITNLVIGKYA